MQRVCASLSRLIESLPSSPARATDVATALSISPQLAWQVFKMATATDPLAAVQFLPTSNQLLRVVAAARAAGVNAEAASETEQACRALDDFITSHARDRREFESMASLFAQGAAEQIEAKQRRALHRANVHVYGIQTTTVYGCLVLHPSATGAGHHATSMIGYVGLHTLRPEVPMSVVAEAGGWNTLGVSPADAAAAERERAMLRQGGTCLVEGFGGGQPPLLVRDVEDGKVVSRVRFPSAGRSGAVSFMIAQEFGNDQPVDTSPQLAVLLTVPAEAMVLDILIPSAWGASGQASVSTYARRGKPHLVTERRPVDQIASLAETTVVPRVIDPPASADVPQLVSTMRAVLGRAGWHGTVFDVYRCRTSHPVLHALVDFSVDPANP